jgi:UV DNA damage endonuclease
MSIDAKVNRTCMAKTYRERGEEYAVTLAKSNLESVMKILEWNNKNNIKIYRMSSSMFPQLTNPEFKGKYKDCDYSYSLEQFQEYFNRIGELAEKYEQRLTFHPGQYNQIGAVSENVFEKTLIDLKMHAEILDRIGCDQDSVMVVHGGGSYGDKKTTLNRWVDNFYRLPENVQNRIVIENCERQYNYKDMINLSKKIHRPVVFDTHHHNCYSQSIRKLSSPDKFIHKIIKRWEKCGIKPKFHISEQAPDKRLGAHSDYVEIIPDYLLNLEIPIDIMIEAKCKDLAVAKLQKKYNIY